MSGRWFSANFPIAGDPIHPIDPLFGLVGLVSWLAGHLVLALAFRFGVGVWIGTGIWYWRASGYEWRCYDTRVVSVSASMHLQAEAY